MSIRHILLLCLGGLVAVAGLAAAQECPECDEDGEPDDSWYSSVDTGVIGEDGGVLEDTDVSVGENEHGRFTWLQYCLQFFDLLGNSITLMVEAFLSEDGADIDAKVNVNGEEIDLEDTLVGDLDDETWDHMEELPVDAPVSHDDLPEPVDIDACVHPDDVGPTQVDASVTATCEIEA